MAWADSYDILHYDLVIEPDFSTGALHFEASIRIDNPLRERSFTFGLNDRYDSIEVREKDSPVKFERGSGRITVTVERPSKVVLLDFDLRGTLGQSNGEERSIVTDSSLFLLWSDRFYPISFDDWAVVRTKVVLPPGFTALAPGAPLETVNLRGKIGHGFETTNPTVCFSVFADKRWCRREKVINGIRMQTLLLPGSERFAEQIFATSAEVLAFYSETFCPYPFDRFTFVTIEDLYARRAFPGFVGYSPDYLEREFTTTGHDAHETALLWWFYTLRGGSPGGFQWTEGFGDYAEFLFDEKHRKPIPKIFRTMRDEFIDSEPSDDVPYKELRGSTPQMIVHGKYPWLMHLIRYKTGDTAFQAAMRLLFEKFRFRTFTMDEFIEILEQGTGQSLRWWREDWLERRGAPTISMRHMTRKLNGHYETTVVIEQSGLRHSMPVEIGIELDKGLMIERIDTGEGTARKVFTTDKEPIRIILDPNDWILAKKVIMSQDVPTKNGEASKTATGR